MRKRAVLLLILTALCGICRAELVTVEPGTPIYPRPEFSQELIGIAVNPFQAEKLGDELVLVRNHPLARYHRFLRVRLPDGKTGYVNPSIVVTPEGKFRGGNVVEPWRLTLLPLLAGAMAALLIVLWKRRREPDPYRWVLIGLVPVVLRQILLLLLVNRAQNLITAPVDEVGYYANLTSFLDRDFSTPWHFTVGTGIFYLPFELVSGTRNLLDIYLAVAWTEGFVIAPASLFLGFMIGRKLTGSVKTAFGAMLVWAVLPFLYHHLPDFNLRWFASFLNWPSWKFTYYHYINLIACGFTAMSDTPSTMTVLLVMTVLLYGKATWRTTALAAFLYAFACLIRINNILFAPALAVMVWCYRPEYLNTPRRLLRNTLAGAAAFLIGFLPQFAANFHFFGNPMRFSYTNYAHGAHTYLHWVFVELTAAFYGTTNQLIWIPALLSLFFMRDRKLRITLIWWAVPVILFFFAYSHGTDDPIRFILTGYPAFFLAIAANRVWKNVGRRELPFLLLILAAWCVTVPNPTFASYEFYFKQPWHLLMRNWELSILDFGSILCIVIAVAALTWRNRELGIFFALVNVLYLLGNAYLLALMLAAALLWAACDTARMLYRELRARRAAKCGESPLSS